MKNVFILILVCALIILTGCTNEEPALNIDKVDDSIKQFDDSSEEVLVFEQGVLDFEIEGDWVYASGMPFKKYNMKSGENMAITSDWVSEFCFYNDKIFYITNEEGVNLLKEINKDGTEKKELIKNVDAFKVYQENILFLDSKLRLNKYSIIEGKVSAVVDCNILSFDCLTGVEAYEDWIYYSNADDDQRIYMTKIDGTEIKTVGEAYGQIQYVDDEWLYYRCIISDPSEELRDELRRINLKTFEEERINKTIDTRVIQQLIVMDDILIYSCEYSGFESGIVMQNIGEEEATILSEDLGYPRFKIYNNYLYFVKYGNTDLYRIEIN